MAQGTGCLFFRFFLQPGMTALPEKEKSNSDLPLFLSIACLSCLSALQVLLPVCRNYSCFLFLMYIWPAPGSREELLRTAFAYHTDGNRRGNLRTAGQRAAQQRHVSEISTHVLWFCTHVSKKNPVYRIAF